MVNTEPQTNAASHLPNKGNLIDFPVWLQVGALLDGLSERPLQNAHLVYSQKTIRYMAPENRPPPAKLVKPGQSQPDLSLPDFTALPGLVEAHAHLFLQGGELDFEKRKNYLQLNPTDLLEKARKRLIPILKTGIMAIRDAGDKDGVGLALSADYKSGSLQPMPYLDSPGSAIYHRGRYGKFMGEPIEDHPNAEACVADRIHKGADRIKLIPTGIINFKKGLVTASPQMTVEEIRALTSAAQVANRQTFAHASGTDGVGNAIEGGVDSIEHGFFITSEQLSRMRDLGTAWTPTFAPVQIQVDFADHMGWSPEIVDHLKRILDGHAKSLRKAREMGVTVIAGSDAGSCGVAHGTGFLYELELMEKAGMKPIEVLNSATGVSARRLGFGEKIGRLQTGSKSRLILTRHQPLNTVKNLRKEKFCLFDGHVFAESCETDAQGL